MEPLHGKTKVVFSRPFTVPGFDETLPAGEYEIEPGPASPTNPLDLKVWKASALVHLHSRLSHPGLKRSLTVCLADLDSARAKDKLSEREVSQLFLEEMLADPMVRLVMKADRVSEMQLRHLYKPVGALTQDPAFLEQKLAQKLSQDRGWDVLAIQTAESEGMPVESQYFSVSPFGITQVVL